MSSADDWLREAWRSLRDGNGVSQKAFVHGAIAMAEHLGALNGIAAELWRRGIETCPGHDDEGGRVWCAYCGELRA